MVWAHPCIARAGTGNQPSNSKHAVTVGTLTSRLGLSFRKSSPRIKHYPAENRDQQPSCVYLVGNTHVLFCTILCCSILCCSILCCSILCCTIRVCLRMRQGGKNQGGCHQSAGLANAVLRSGKHDRVGLICRLFSTQVVFTSGSVASGSVGCCFDSYRFDVIRLDCLELEASGFAHTPDQEESRWLRPKRRPCRCGSEIGEAYHPDIRHIFAKLEASMTNQFADYY